ncbi:hypothetical protein V8C86DRAFT_2519221 [Haematococcus lacustris]
MEQVRHISSRPYLGLSEVQAVSSRRSLPLLLLRDLLLPTVYDWYQEVWTVVVVLVFFAFFRRKCLRLGALLLPALCPSSGLLVVAP